MTARIRHLFLSPGHNYFGHHGQPAGRNPIVEVSRISCVAGKGIESDRFYGYKENYKGQITFFAWEVFVALRESLGLETEKTPADTRRNVITEGIALNDWIGRKFELQGILFEGVEECRPCYWMDSAFRVGAEDELKGRGGLRARILTTGDLITGPADLKAQSKTGKGAAANGHRQRQ